jgi:predicted nucleic acid-binding protein
MTLSLFIDSNILGQLVQPVAEKNRPVVTLMERLFHDVRYQICFPEIVDYELRRKLLHLAHHPHQARKWAREALKDLDQLVSRNYIPITTETMRLAAELWAQTRISGRPRGSEEKLDIDVILAAQAQQAGGQIITTNEKHFRDIAEVFDWRSFQP